MVRPYLLRYCISHCLETLSGLVVSLNDTGYVSVTYLGTDPSNSVVNSPVEAKELNYDDMDKELRQLQNSIREATSASRTGIRVGVAYCFVDTLQNPLIR